MGMEFGSIHGTVHKKNPLNNHKIGMKYYRFDRMIGWDYWIFISPPTLTCLWCIPRRGVFSFVA